MAEWVKLSAFRHFVPCLLQAGIKPASFLREAGVPESLLLHPSGWLEVGVALHLTERAAAATGNDCFGLEIGRRTSLADFGEWGRGFFEPVRFGVALRRAASSVEMVETGLEFSLRTCGADAIAAVGFRGRLTVDPIQHHLAHVEVLRKMLDRVPEQIPLDVRIPAQGLAAQASIARALNDRVQFGGTQVEVRFPRELLELEMRSVDGFDSVESPPDNAAQSAPSRVLDGIRTLIQHERPTVSSTAKCLGLNVRTLQRQLSGWGITFDRILDEYRCYLALALLERGNESVTEVAFQLGYSDSAHFTRAMRRWTGLSPRELLQDADCLSNCYRRGGFRLTAPFKVHASTPARAY